MARRERVDQRGWGRDQLPSRAARHHRLRSGGSRCRRPRRNGRHRRAVRRPRPELVLDLHSEAAAVLRKAAVSASGRAARHHRHVQDEENGFAERGIQSELHQGLFRWNLFLFCSKEKSRLHLYWLSNSNLRFTIYYKRSLSYFVTPILFIFQGLTKLLTFSFFRISSSSTTLWWVSTGGWTTVFTTTSSKWGVEFEKSPSDNLLTFSFFVVPLEIAHFKIEKIEFRESSCYENCKT